MTTNDTATLPERDANGQLPAFGWPGCYPLQYFTKDGLVVCAKCASRDIDDAQSAVIGCSVYWEGPAMQCDDCNAVIESAYGDPDVQTN